MTDPTDEETRGHAVDIALAQLKFHHDRIAAGSDLVSTVGQFLFVIFGAVILAALKLPEVLVVIPLIWSAWMLHSLQRTADTTKHVVLARRLEKQLNGHAGPEEVALWTTTMTAGAPDPPSVFVTMANFVYWMVLYVASWVVSIVVLLDRHHPEWAVGAGVLAVVVVTTAASAALRLRSFDALCESRLPTP